MTRNLNGSALAAPLPEGDVHGPAVSSARRSHRRPGGCPVAGGHSIWELVLHLAGTYRLVLRRLGGEGRPLSPEDDWPPLPAVTPQNWRDAVDALRPLNQDLRRAVWAFAPDRLDTPLVADPPYSAYTQFIGITQHDLYHAGQIAMLKRALGPTQNE